MMNSMKGYDPNGQTGPRKRLPDSVEIQEPPPEKIISEPSSEPREPAVVSVPSEEYVQQPEGYSEEPVF